MNYHWPAKKKPFFFAPRCFHRLNYYLGKTDFFLRIFLILSVRFLRRNMRQDCCNPSPIVYSFYTERRAQNINLTENIQIKFYFMKDARKYRDMAWFTNLFNSSPAVRQELTGIFLSSFDSILTSKSPVRVLCRLLRHNHNDSSLFFSKVLYNVLDDTVFKVRISRTHSKQHNAVFGHHILACLENEAVFNLSKIEAHFDSVQKLLCSAKYLCALLRDVELAEVTSQCFTEESFYVTRLLWNWPINSHNGWNKLRYKSPEIILSNDVSMHLVSVYAW